MKITPAFFSSSWKVVATETESNTASTATRERGFSSSPSGPTTPARSFCSRSGMPSFS